MSVRSDICHVYHILESNRLLTLPDQYLYNL